jgi:hypothetical protein
MVITYEVVEFLLISREGGDNNNYYFRVHVQVPLVGMI